MIFLIAGKMYEVLYPIKAKASNGFLEIWRTLLHKSESFKWFPQDLETLSHIGLYRSLYKILSFQLLFEVLCFLK